MPLHKFGVVELIAALYTRLTTDALTSTYTVYQAGSVPLSPSPEFPYVTIGGLLGGKSGGFTSRDIKGEDLVIHAHVWSDAGKDDEAGDMMDNIIQAVTGTDLSLTGYTTLIGIHDFSQLMIDDTDPSRLLRHGVIRFRFQVA